jgi:hypothetical protein
MLGLGPSIHALCRCVKDADGRAKRDHKAEGTRRLPVIPAKPKARAGIQLEEVGRESWITGLRCAPPGMTEEATRHCEECGARRGNPEPCFWTMRSPDRHFAEVPRDGGV